MSSFPLNIPTESFLDLAFHERRKSPRGIDGKLVENRSCTTGKSCWSRGFDVIFILYRGDRPRLRGLRSIFSVAQHANPLKCVLFYGDLGWVRIHLADIENIGCIDLSKGNTIFNRRREEDKGQGNSFGFEGGIQINKTVVILSGLGILDKVNEGHPSCWSFNECRSAKEFEERGCLVGNLYTKSIIAKKSYAQGIPFIDYHRACRNPVFLTCPVKG
jgi:hypothetical protein